jgi:predicted MPP superfamily phosphohydrolase
MSLFISKRYRLLYTVIYLLAAAVYPIAQGFPEGNANLFQQSISAISGYSLPFFLYLFMFVVLFDLFLLINHLVKIISPEKRKCFPFRLYMLSAMIALSLAVVVAGAINLNRIRVSEYNITVPKRSSNIDHLRVVFVADFHIRQNTSPHYVEHYVRKVKALKPDLLLYGGDIVEGDSENETTEFIEKELRNIPAKYGAYGVPGNHEFYGGHDKKPFFQRAGIAPLFDTIISINNSFYLAGRYDEHFRNRKTIGEILGSETRDMPVILVDHRPTQLQEVSRTETDVQFSGHTHNGQLFPINLIVGNMFELSWGYRKIRNTHFFVTSGLRLWGPPVKTAGKSEIMLVNIEFK